MRNKLSTIANAQHRHLADELVQVDLKRFGVVDGIRRPREDNTYHGVVAHREFVVRQNLAEGVKFTDTAANELRGL